MVFTHIRSQGVLLVIVEVLARLQPATRILEFLHEPLGFLLVCIGCPCKEVFTEVDKITRKPCGAGWFIEELILWSNRIGVGEAELEALLHLICTSLSLGLWL